MNAREGRACARPSLGCRVVRASAGEARSHRRGRRGRCRRGRGGGAGLIGATGLDRPGELDHAVAILDAGLEGDTRRAEAGAATATATVVGTRRRHRRRRRRRSSRRHHRHRRRSRSARRRRSRPRRARRSEQSGRTRWAQRHPRSACRRRHRVCHCRWPSRRRRSRRRRRRRRRRSHRRFRRHHRRRRRLRPAGRPGHRERGAHRWHRRRRRHRVLRRTSSPASPPPLNPPNPSGSPMPPTTTCSVSPGVTSMSAVARPPRPGRPGSAVPLPAGRHPSLHVDLGLGAGCAVGVDGDRADVGGHHELDGLAGERELLAVAAGAGLVGDGERAGGDQSGRCGDARDGTVDGFHATPSCQKVLPAGRTGRKNTPCVGGRARDPLTRRHRGPTSDPVRRVTASRFGRAAVGPAKG